jgi:sugar (pentulose or hexulose) kinase
MTGLLIGIDVGTTRVKAVVQTVDGVPRGSASVATPWSRDRDGTQLDADALARAVREVAGVAAERGLARAGAGGNGGQAWIAGIGVTGMGESGVLTGPDGAVLGPVRAWHDQRGDPARIGRELGEAAFLRTAGMPLDPQPSLAKILGLQVSHPQTLAAQRFYSVPEWAVKCLGGDPGSELSLASRTGLLDVVAGRAWAAAAELVGALLLGPLTAAGDPAGVAGGDQVPACLHGAVLTVAGHDHQTAALAAGAVRDGVLFDSVGTAEALLRFVVAPVTAELVGSLAAQRITVGLTVVPGHHCALAGLPMGLGLERISSLLGADTPQQRAALGQAAVELDRLPETAGVEIVGDSVLVRLDDELTGPQLWAREVHDLVGRADEALARLRGALGIEREVMVTGGWLANPAVLAAKRRQFPQLVRSDLAEAGAAGAARLAGQAAGLVAVVDVVPPPMAGPEVPSAPTPTREATR